MRSSVEWRLSLSLDLLDAGACGSGRIEMRPIRTNGSSDGAQCGCRFRLSTTARRSAPPGGALLEASDRCPDLGIGNGGPSRRHGGLLLGSHWK